MKEIIDALNSPAWWFTAILAGLSINLLAAYCKPWIDQVGSRLSTAWRNRVSQKQVEFAATMARLKSDRQFQLAFAYDGITARIRSVFAFLIGMSATASAFAIRIFAESTIFTKLLFISGCLAAGLAIVISLIEHHRAAQSSAMLLTAVREAREPVP